MSNTDNFIMSPKVDFAFKELMRDETVRKGFLSAVLGIKDTNCTLEHKLAEDT